MVKRNFKLRRNQIRKIGKIHLNESSMWAYNDLRQRAQKIYTASLSL
jgi:hypothetical protein